MSLYDRDYTQSDFGPGRHSVPRMRMDFPRLTPVVKVLLIINIAVYVMQVLGAAPFLMPTFSVFPVSLRVNLQFWRLITYQFLHGGIFHLFLNMLGLYFLGPTLERYWHGRKFVIFYLCCGACGGLAYISLASIGFLGVGPMVGASGAILGMLAACAVLFPQFIVFIIIFPVPIRIAAIALTIIYFLNVLSKGANAGGDAAHLAGMAAGAIYVFSQSWRSRIKLKVQSYIMKNKMASHRNLQLELDRILKKVHDKGIHSLSSKEKKLLRQATEAERKRNAL